MVDWNKQKKWIDFGITTYCNAACPGCPRTDEVTLTHKGWLTPTHANTENLIEIFDFTVLRKNNYPLKSYVQFHTPNYIYSYIYHIFFVSLFFEHIYLRFLFNWQ